MCVCIYDFFYVHHLIFKSKMNPNYFRFKLLAHENVRPSRSQVFFILKLKPEILY